MAGSIEYCVPRASTLAIVRTRLDLLNLGCGSRYHPSWLNVDFKSSDPGVVAHDLSKGIPFGDETFDALYHSHLLEHFPRESALPFLQDCWRVLRRGAIMRIVVPDLEVIARLYLRALESAVDGSEEWQHNYEWMLLELYDQTVRERPGGEMAGYLTRALLPNKEFVLGRSGGEGRRILEHAELHREEVTDNRHLRRARMVLRSPLRAVRELLLMAILGREYELLQLGRFRRGGEVHLWMYDRYSLSRLLLKAGFERRAVVGATESQIPNWSDYNLDTNPDGTVYKPDSLYMEALKP